MRPARAPPFAGPRPAKSGSFLSEVVVAVLRAVWQATAARSPPYYVSVDSLGLPEDPERNDAAILLGVLSGYLTAGGDPRHSVAITEAGRALLKGLGVKDGGLAPGG